MDKIDNTAPTIVSASIHNNKLNVVANDVKEGLGEGSGVTKYRYITSDEKIDNPSVDSTAREVQKDEKFVIENIDNVKYVYVVAEDKVGNVSDVYEVEVPQLVLTSKVNLSGNNGKGVIELDWSGYDISDKYFVVYRKKEGEERWKTIVSLEEKFNGSRYIDSTGIDKNSPIEPNINIEGNKETNSIEIESTVMDSGTKYQYYVESYDTNDMSLLNSSK